MHSQFLARSDFACRPVARNEDLVGAQSGPLLDLAESCLFGQYVIAVSKIDFLNRRFAVQPQSLHFCALDLRFTKADNEISDAAFGQKTQQRQ